MDDTAAQIIDDKGGPAAVAAKVGRSPGAVRVWKHRDAFPRDAWPEIIDAYPDVTLERLKDLERSRPGRSIVEPANTPAPQPEAMAS